MDLCIGVKQLHLDMELDSSLINTSVLKIGIRKSLNERSRFG